MPRPKKPRWISNNPGVTYFMPQSIPVTTLNQVLLTIDELEALRLADIESLSQEEAARRMKVSRATFGRIIALAHNKVADALIHGKGIHIKGGEVAFHPPFAHGRGGGGPHGPHGHGKGPWR